MDEALTRIYQRQLINLNWHWGTSFDEGGGRSVPGAYDISHDGKSGEWRAVRTDDEGVLTAETADELLQKIRDDYAFQPVRRPPVVRRLNLEERNSS